MKITVCIGSSCHLKGSKGIVDQLQDLIAANKLEDRVELAATFCTGNCQQGVCVTIDETLFSVKPDTTETFFKTEVLPRL
ncbi:MAG: (2Fe-2S) ferredoxin domain-containing protein [Candidatus Merdivicinus sp.]|jgi:NADH:ubiquinone oxidoreductase subunit E